MSTAIIVLAVLAAVAAAACAWLLLERTRLLAQSRELADQLEVSEQQAQSLRDANAAYAGDTKALNARLEANNTAFQVAQTQLRDVFQSLAADALVKSSEQFLKLATERLAAGQKDAEGQLALRKKEIEGLVQPVKETLEKYQKSLQEIEGARKEAYGGLKTQVGQLATDQQQLRKETANLVQALHRSDVRGRWGEVQLRRVAELAGMIANCDFYEQESQSTEGGTLRPDMIVRLPGKREIVVDAKTPIDAYLNAVECADDAPRAAFLEKHAQQIEGKVRDLSAKQYWAQFQRSPEFVVLFIPGESFLYSAVQVRPGLIEWAMGKNVVIATPSTLIALLKAVAQGWREERIAENAQHISDLGEELHKRLCTAVEHLGKVGGALESAVRSYNQFVGSFESQVIVQARRFEELGAKSAKALPSEVPTVELMPRQVRDSAPNA